MMTYHGHTCVLPGSENANAAVLNAERWLMEEYGALLDLIQAASWWVIISLGFALIAYLVIKRPGKEIRTIAH